MAHGAGTDVVRTEPQRAHNAGVQAAPDLQGPELAAKGKAQVGDILCGILGTGQTLKTRHVDTQQMRRSELMHGFFQRLSGTRCQKAFTFVQMAGRVVQAHAFRRVFFHQQKFATSLNDCGHGGAGFPSVCHARIIDKFGY